jgi:hypothetical protein
MEELEALSRAKAAARAVKACLGVGKVPPESRLEPPTPIQNALLAGINIG